MKRTISRGIRVALLAGGAFSALAAALLVGCGGDDEEASSKQVELERWVEDVCELALDYEDRLGEVEDELDALDLSDRDAKDEFVSLIKDGDRISGQRHRDFLKIGEPDIRGGDDVVQAFADHHAANQDNIDDLLDAVDELEGGESFAEDLFEVLDGIESRSLRERLEELAEDEDEIQDLIDLIDDDPDCAAAIFDDEAQTQAPDPTPSRTAAASRTAQRLPTARTTAAPNATRNERWVVGFCTAFATWGNDIAVLGDGVPSVSEPVAGKNALVALMESATARSRQFSDELHALGTPDVKDGTKIQQTLTAMGNSSVAVFERATRQARALPTNNATAFQTEAQKVITEFENAFGEVVAGLDDLDQYDTSALDALFANVPECAELQ